MNSAPPRSSLMASKERFLPLCYKPAGGFMFSSLSDIQARQAARRSVLIPRARALALIFSLVTLFAGPSPAAEDVTLLKDLTSAIMVLDMPCGQVVSAKRQADNDHIASCKNGIRYRVFVNAEGRVVAQRQ